MPGMLICGLGRVVAYRMADGWPELDITDGVEVARYRGSPSVLFEPAQLASARHVDLADPATLGCLLALVREAWGGADLLIRVNADGTVFLGVGDNSGWVFERFADSLGEAGVAALEAAP